MASNTVDQLIQSICDQVSLMCRLPYTSTYKVSAACLQNVVDDSTFFELCNRKGVYVIQESVDIAARWTEQNGMNFYSEKSKEIVISFYTRWQFQKHFPEYKERWEGYSTSLPCQTVRCDHFSEKFVKNAGKRLYILYQRAEITQ